MTKHGIGCCCQVCKPKPKRRHRRTRPLPAIRYEKSHQIRVVGSYTINPGAQTVVAQRNRYRVGISLAVTGFTGSGGSGSPAFCLQVRAYEQGETTSAVVAVLAQCSMWPNPHGDAIRPFLMSQLAVYNPDPNYSQSVDVIEIVDSSGGNEI